MSVLLPVLTSVAAILVVNVACMAIWQRLAGGPLMKHNTKTGGILVHDYLVWAMLTMLVLSTAVGLAVIALFMPSA